MDFLSWKDGEPNDCKDEDCTELVNFKKDVSVTWAWNDQQCEDENGFICKMLESKYSMSIDWSMFHLCLVFACCIVLPVCGSHSIIVLLYVT